jgi:integrase
LGNLYKHNAIDHSIRRIVNNHNAEEEIKAKKEHREPIMLPFFSCHTFRHTFCTRFCENETNVKVIQAVMGHADINTTMDIYAEVTETKKKESMDNLSKNLKIF